MKKTIDAFIADKNLAIVGVSPRKENWGNALMTELKKSDYNIVPVNPKFEDINGVKCYPSVADLPKEIENVIIAVNPDLALEVAPEFRNSGVKRVWFQRGMGKGSYSEEAHKIFDDAGIEVIYGFCPMMFIGSGFHKFHFWIRRNLGKTPEGFSMN